MRVPSSGGNVEVHHHPKPWGNWREFLREYLIVVVGVMTALAAEQFAEWLHWRHEVAETRRALNAEVAYDLASAEWHAKLAACKLKRLDALDQWRASLQAGRPLKLKGPMAPTELLYLTATWRAANGNSVAQLPVEERNAYAAYYDLIQVFVDTASADREHWASLAKATYYSRWDESQLVQIKADIEALRSTSRVYAVNMTPLRASAKQVDVTTVQAVDAFNKEMASLPPAFVKVLARAPAEFCSSPFA
jgi:hypothetical protein